MAHPTSLPSPDDRMGSIELERVTHFVLRKQHLTPDSTSDDIVQTVRDLGGLHATSSTTPYLSLAARCANFRRQALERELYVNRTLGRIRCVRKTIYVLPADLIPTAYQPTAGVVQGISTRYLESRGVSREQYAEASAAILQALRRVADDIHQYAYWTT